MREHRSPGLTQAPSHKQNGTGMGSNGSIARGVARWTLTALAGVALVVGAASAAQAKAEYHYWNSSSVPLTVSGYGSTVKTYGQWRVADSTSGTRSWFDARTSYHNADNHKKYVKFETWTSSGYCIQPSYTTCTAQFYYYAGAESRHSNVTGWEWLYGNTDLPISANSAKGANFACLDVPWRADPCSTSAVTTGSNY